MGNNNNRYISIRILQKFQLNKKEQNKQVNPFRAELQSEFQLKETDGKRIHQEILKKWRKKIARNMFSQETKYEF